MFHSLHLYVFLYISLSKMLRRSIETHLKNGASGADRGQGWERRCFDKRFGAIAWQSRVWMPVATASRLDSVLENRPAGIYQGGDAVVNDSRGRRGVDRRAPCARTLTTATVSSISSANWASDSAPPTPPYSLVSLSRPSSFLCFGRRLALNLSRTAADGRGLTRRWDMYRPDELPDSRVQTGGTEQNRRCRVAGTLGTCIRARSTPADKSAATDDRSGSFPR